MKMNWMFSPEERSMNDTWVDFAIRIQSIAQAGLQYGRDKYDLERYEQLRTIAAEMLSVKTDIPIDEIRGLFCNETGYQTPKIDTRAAVFIDERILLVRENDGRWALPGGWCDVDQSVASNAEKEVLEETGCTVSAQRLIAVQDWRKHNVTNYAYGVVKFSCSAAIWADGFGKTSKPLKQDFLESGKFRMVWR